MDPWLHRTELGPLPLVPDFQHLPQGKPLRGSDSCRSRDSGDALERPHPPTPPDHVYSPSAGQPSGHGRSLSVFPPSHLCCRLDSPLGLRISDEFGMGFPFHPFARSDPPASVHDSGGEDAPKDLSRGISQLVIVSAPLVVGPLIVEKGFHGIGRIHKGCWQRVST